MFSIDEGKLKEAVELFNQEVRPVMIKINTERARAEICSDRYICSDDRSEDDREYHQIFIDRASSQGIADWLIRYFYYK